MSNNQINYEQWLSVTIDSFHQALDKYNIGKLDGNLWKSIAGEVVHSGQDVEEIIIKFLQYGRFVDMGTGRGFKKGNRKQKLWFSKTKTREVARLRELLINEMGSKVITELKNSFCGDLNIYLINTKQNG